MRPGRPADDLRPHEPQVGGDDQCEGGARTDPREGGDRMGVPDVGDPPGGGSERRCAGHRPEHVRGRHRLRCRTGEVHGGQRKVRGGHNLPEQMQERDEAHRMPVQDRRGAVNALRGPERTRGHGRRRQHAGDGQLLEEGLPRRLPIRARGWTSDGPGRRCRGP